VVGDPPPSGNAGDAGGGRLNRAEHSQLTMMPRIRCPLWVRERVAPRAFSLISEISRTIIRGSNIARPARQEAT
jgi:hypothetical protein